MSVIGISTYLGIAIGGGVGTLVLAAITKLGDPLFKHVLARNMEAYKHGLGSEIERLRAQLDHYGDRGIRSNEREYNAIVTAWERFVEAYQETSNCLTSFVPHVQLDTMDSEALDAWLKDMSLPKEAEKDIREAKTDKREFAYNHYRRFQSLADARNAEVTARNTLRKQGIFIPRDLERKFMSALDRIAIALAHEQADYEKRATSHSHEGVANYLGDAFNIFEGLKNDSRARLMYKESAPPQAQS